LIVAPVAGALSDRSPSLRGRRRPYLLAGGLMNVAALLAMGSLGRGSAVGTFMLGVVGVQFSANWWGGPYAGLIPDVVPDEQRGQASGYLAFMTIVGTVAGAVMSAQLLTAGGYPAAYDGIAAVLLALLLLTLWRVGEPPGRPDEGGIDWREFIRSFWLDPRVHRDFYWVLATRAAVTMGIFAVYSFVQYYLADVLHVSNPQVLGSLLLAVGAAAGLPAGLVAGGLSDRYGRKRLIYMSGGLMALSALIYSLITFNPAWWAVLVLAAVLGAGSGGYQAVDWAFAIDVLPGRRDAGKDMGIWHVALVLPQVLAPPMSGLLLNSLKGVSLPLAYAGLFVMAAVWFILGTVLVAQVKSVR